MSAIPNIPETLTRTHDLPTTEAHQHLHHQKASAQQSQHIENTASPPTQNGPAIQQNGAAPSSETKTSPPGWKLYNEPVENQRKLRVVVIGAGYSGVYLGIRIPERLRNCELVVYEKNRGVGGTWYENRYPGAACDIASHSYQFSFNPKHDWSALYAPSWEIRDYIEGSAKKYGADRFIKLEHEVLDCRWEEGEGKWHIKVKQPDGTVFEDVGDVLISARGNLNTKAWPQIDGLNNFAGDVMHSAEWNDSVDFKNKRIGVIGSGSSAIQIVPKLQQVQGTQLSCFIRSRTWISPPFSQRIQDEMGLEGIEFSAEQIEKFAQDPQAWYDFRLKLEADANNIHGVTLKGTEMQKGAKKMFEDGMRERLKKKPEYMDYLQPSFAPGCRRLTPGPGFLEALVEDNVDFVRDEITRITPQGIQTADGKLHELDILVCATGFHASAAPPFPITTSTGHSLQHQWRERATNYMSFAVDNIPNHFMMLGPNGAIGEGSLTMMIESTGSYIVKAIRKLQKENIKSMVVKPERVEDFMEYTDAYFRGTVFMDDCKSWYRKNGRGESGDVVTGLWPGSCMHYLEAARSPRWEDYVYSYWPTNAEVEGDGHGGQGKRRVNQMAWLGNGWSQGQLEDKVDEEKLAFYVMPLFQERELGVPEPGRPEDNRQFAVRPFSN